MLKDLLRKIFHFTRFEFFNIEKDLPDERLLPKLRTRIHVLEKRIQEGECSFLKMISARRLYFEAKKRGVLSEKEDEWCRKILFGEDREGKNEHGEKDKGVSIDTALKGRRSVRSWNNSQITKNEFEKLIEAAKWAPSSCNKQPWHFIVTSDSENIKLLYEIKDQKFLKDAPYIILVLINKDAWSSKKSFEYFSGLDAGAAIENLLLKAEDLGLGACWVNWNPSSISKKEKMSMKKRFNIPSNMEIVTIIPIGKYENKPPAPGRKDTDKIIHFEKFQAKN